MSKLRQVVLDNHQHNNHTSQKGTQKHKADYIDQAEILSKQHLVQSKHSSTEGNLMTEVSNMFSLNKEQDRAFHIVSQHSICPISDQLRMYIGGMSGTGKSQVIKALSEFFNQRKESN